MFDEWIVWSIFPAKDFSDMVEPHHGWLQLGNSKKDLHWVRIRRVSYHSPATPGPQYMCQCVWLCFCLRMMWWVFLLCPQQCLLKTIDTQGFVLNWLPVLSVWGLSLIHGTRLGLTFHITSVKKSSSVCDYKYSWKTTQIVFLKHWLLLKEMTKWSLSQSEHSVYNFSAI